VDKQAHGHVHVIKALTVRDGLFKLLRMLSHAAAEGVARLRRISVTPPRIFISGIGMAIRLPDVTDLLPGES
jgi:hypothetical protein